MIKANTSNIPCQSKYGVRTEMPNGAPQEISSTKSYRVILTVYLVRIKIVIKM
jgi:hypothetical protein